MSEGSESCEPKTAEDQATSSDQPVANVHSANKWEAADLGDTDRKQKFLRLMGATKKTHQAPLVCGEHETGREAAGAHSAEVEQELEHQFAESLEHKLSGGMRRHLGLGFHDSDKEAEGKTGDIVSEASEEVGQDKDERKDKDERHDSQDKDERQDRDERHKREERRDRDERKDRDLRRDRDDMGDRDERQDREERGDRDYRRDRDERHGDRDERKEGHRSRSPVEHTEKKEEPQDPVKQAKSKFAMSFVKSSS